MTLDLLLVLVVNICGMVMYPAYVADGNTEEADMLGRVVVMSCTDTFTVGCGSRSDINNDASSLCVYVYVCDDCACVLSCVCVLTDTVSTVNGVKMQRIIMLKLKLKLKMVRVMGMNGVCVCVCVCECVFECSNAISSMFCSCVCVQCLKKS